MRHSTTPGSRPPIVFLVFRRGPGPSASPGPEIRWSPPSRIGLNRDWGREPSGRRGSSRATFPGAERRKLRPQARIPPHAAVAQLARASACHAEGRGFESLQPLVTKAPLRRGFLVPGRDGIRVAEDQSGWLRAPLRQNLSMTPAPSPSPHKNARSSVFARVAAACAVVLLAILAAAGSATASTWTMRQLAPIRNSENEPVQIGLSGISCPSESLCVAVGGREGTIAFSQNPTGGSASWHEVKLEYPVGPGKTCVEGEPDCEPPSGALQAVSCASESFCALTTYDGWIFVSTDPTGGTDTWLPVNVNSKSQKGATHLISISCPSPSFCAAVSGGSNNANGGQVLTSTNPVAGQWQTTQLGSQLDLRSISCGTPSLCVVAARGGRLFSSTDPTGGAGAWQVVATPVGAGDLEGASCLSTVFCAVGNMTGNILTTTNPAAGGGATWSEVNAGGSVQVTGVSCPAADACLAVDDNGDVMTSTDPTGGAGAWHFENLMPFKPEGQPHNALFGASCASTSLCALVAGEGRIFTSTEPFAAPDPPGYHQGGKARLPPENLPRLRGELLEHQRDPPPASRPRPLSLLLADQDEWVRMQARPRSLPPLPLAAALLGEARPSRPQGASDWADRPTWSTGDAALLRLPAVAAEDLRYARLRTSPHANKEAQTPGARIEVRPGRARPFFELRRCRDRYARTRDERLDPISGERGHRR